jgi:hypothetical protein
MMFARMHHRNYSFIGLPLSARNLYRIQGTAHAPPSSVEHINVNHTGASVLIA